MRVCAEIRLCMSSSEQAKAYRASCFGEGELGRGEVAFLKGQIIVLAVRSVTSANLHCVERSDKLTCI